MLNRQRQWLIVFAVVVGILSVAGCSGHTSIADINRDPGRFTGKDVTIAGNVSDAFGALGTGIFQVDDGSGSMWVLSQNFGLPSNGVKVSVTGQVEQGFSFGGKNYGVILRETEPRR